MCYDQRVSRGKVFRTFARTLPSSSKVSKSVIALLKHFDWMRVTIVVAETTTYVQTHEVLVNLAKTHNISVTGTYMITGDYMETNADTLHRIVQDSYETTRIYILLTDTHALIDFVGAMERKGLLGGGEYAIISVEEDEIYNPMVHYQFMIKEKNGGTASWPISDNMFMLYFSRLAIWSSGVACVRSWIDLGCYVDSAASDTLEWDRPHYDSRFDATPFRSVLMITPCAPQLEAYQKFQENVQKFAGQPPLCIPFHPQVQVDIPPYAAMAYDAVWLYARAATELLNRNQSLDNGTALIDVIRNNVYRSVMGFDIRVDENGEAEGNYTVLGFANASDEHLSPIGKFSIDDGGATSNGPNTGALPIFQLESEVAWLGGAPPLSEPRCGFFKEKCISKQDWRGVLLMASCGSLLAAALLAAARHYRYEYRLAKLLWKIDIRDVLSLPHLQHQQQHMQQQQQQTSNSGQHLQQQRSRQEQRPNGLARTSSLPNSTMAAPPSTHHRATMFASVSPGTFSPDVSPDEDYCEPTDADGNCSRVGFYKGNMVFIKPIHKKSIDLTRSIRKELIQMREMRHENVNPFIGACVDPPNICVFTMYCARGSLEDVLRNEDLTLDGIFVSSLVADLLKGMIYIHDSDIVSHGNLKSSNCLVDSRWVLQITDFGLHEFRSGQSVPNTSRRNRALLWRAPELLREQSPPARGTQKGDVYSFAIVLYEIIGRGGPWGPDALPSKCIIDAVMSPPDPIRPPRPPLDALNCPDYVVCCLRECWDENPDQRPDFRFVNVRLREMQAGLKPNIFDNMIAIMEKYAYNLESLVQERTYQLLEEKKKTENLLLRMLPKPVAEQLKRGEPVQAESFESVTIYFSDIVGFTELSAKSSPLQVVNLLNSLYTCFDSIIENYNVYKVETIGDAYMVVSGLPLKTCDHAAQIACMALHLLAAIAGFEIPHRPGERLMLRIGVHSGPCVAGVVGLKMPRYCLFGDTVNTASRMESTGLPLRIHISETCKKLLEKAGGFCIEERGLTMVKGKGEMRTYWLLGKANNSSSSSSNNNNNDSTQCDPAHAGASTASTPLATTPTATSGRYASFSAQFLQPVTLSTHNLSGSLRSNSLSTAWLPSPSASVKSSAFHHASRTYSTGGGRLPFFR
ncbi:guanylate cyclase 32E-like [Tropilaelaps mercedesae]|uniref:Guanylate cyclase n=1 Tax=Tropilaelaps mercedesae TaxID=418985 RepID=A0A1V9XMA4_9ACAR|nr:guanylate cyclase 32E-like [Tropilaelaps mercedesae]